MLAEPAPPSGRTLPGTLRALLQLLAAALAMVAIYWIGLRLPLAVLSDPRLTPLPLGALDLVEVGVLGLAALPVVTLAALWLRDLAGAPVPQSFALLCRAVLGAWGYVLAALVLPALLFPVLLLLLELLPWLAPPAPTASLDSVETWLRLALLHDLPMALLWLLLLPRALARLCGQRVALRYGSFGRWLLCLLLFAAPLAVDFLIWLFLLEEVLLLWAQPSWELAGYFYVQALAFALTTALAFLGAWALLRRP